MSGGYSPWDSFSSSGHRRHTVRRRRKNRETEGIEAELARKIERAQEIKRHTAPLLEPDEAFVIDFLKGSKGRSDRGFLQRLIFAKLHASYLTVFEELLRRGLIKIDAKEVCLTPKGWHFGVSEPDSKNEETVTKPAYRTTCDKRNGASERQDREWRVDWHEHDPLKPAGVFVIQVLKLRELYDRSRLEHLIWQRFSEIGEFVTKALLRRGLIEEYSSDVRLTRSGKLIWVPEMDSELKRIVTEPYCKAACDPVNGLDWITLVNVGHGHYAIDTLPEKWMRWHAEDLMKAGLIREHERNKLLELTEKGQELLLPEIYPENPRAGNDWHRWKIGERAWHFQMRGFHSFIDFGRLGRLGRPAVSQPDDTLTLFSFKLRGWDKSRQFANEVESDPLNHPDNVRDNYFRNVAYVLPTLFEVRMERDRDAVIKAIEKLKKTKFLERTIKRAPSLDAEQIQHAKNQIKKHPPKMVTPDRLTGRHCRPTTFAIDVEQVRAKPTRKEIKAYHENAMGQEIKPEIQHKKSGYYLTQRIGSYRRPNEKIEPWLVRWFVKRGIKIWGKG